MAGSSENRFMATNESINLSDISLESTILEESAISHEDPQDVAAGDKTPTCPSNESVEAQNVENGCGSDPTNLETSQVADGFVAGKRGDLTKGTEVRVEVEEGKHGAQDGSSKGTPSGQTALQGAEEGKAEESGREALDQIARNGLTSLLTKSAHFMAQTQLDEEESGKILGFISEAFDIGRRLRPRRSRSKKTAPHVEGGKQRTKSQTDQRPKGPRSKSRTKSKVPSTPASEDKASGPVLPKSKARKRKTSRKKNPSPTAPEQGSLDSQIPETPASFADAAKRGAPKEQAKIPPNKGRSENGGFQAKQARRASTGVLIVLPKQDSQLTSSKQVLKLLDRNISLGEIGVTMVANKWGKNNSLVLVTKTKQMAETLKKAITDSPTVAEKVEVSDPKGRSPHIIVFDVPAKETEDRAKFEDRWLKKLRKSNNLPEGEMKVKFRRKGRKESQHWIISLDPVVF
ncbi:hypothetical protein AVEN_198309-1 [Araneus ventricosus]|uniref:DUF4780 domain-containing protein n=1 Tax=Araneus ventricosus TaxID=182803 RepID=A0A4Y2RM50_ARAVE|nr:hypothetical protein AVEN_198309-1 [Araneus ventricosus]